MLSWQIGDVKVTRIVEIELPVPYSARAALSWRTPRQKRCDGTTGSIHTT